MEEASRVALGCKLGLRLWFFASLGSVSVASDPDFLGLSTGLEPVSAHAQPEALLVTSVSGSRFSSPPLK